jgi:hypothetical protein
MIPSKEKEENGVTRRENKNSRQDIKGKETLPE